MMIIERLAVVLAIVGMLVAAVAAFAPDFQPGPAKRVPITYGAGAPVPMPPRQPRIVECHPDFWGSPGSARCVDPLANTDGRR